MPKYIKNMASCMPKHTLQLLVANTKVFVPRFCALLLRSGEGSGSALVGGVGAWCLGGSFTDRDELPLFGLSASRLSIAII